jgi:hypothetical protein
MLSKTQIKDLKKRLKKPYFKAVVEKSGVSERSVSKFFEGKSYSITIHTAVLDLIEVYEREKADLLDRQNATDHAK